MKNTKDENGANCEKTQKPAWAKRLKPSDPFFYLNYFIEIEIDAMNSFLDDAEKQIPIKENELNEKLEAWKAEKHLSPDAPDAYDMYESEIINVGHIPKLLYNSFFLTSYSCFEKRMFEICSICKEEFEIKISANDIKGKDYLDQCKKYIEKVVEVNLGCLNSAWSDLSNYRKLRNAIVHNDGVLKNDDFQSVSKYFSNNTDIKIAPKDKSLSIESSGFIRAFNTLFSKYLSDLTSEIEKQKNLS